MKPPSDEELAAIAIALAAVTTSTAKSPPRDERERRIDPWAMAARLPDLEFDELLALRHACSVRY